MQIAPHQTDGDIRTYDSRQRWGQMLGWARIDCQKFPVPSMPCPWFMGWDGMGCPPLPALIDMNHSRI